MALSGHSIGIDKGVEFSPDGRTVLPMELGDRVARAERRGFLTLLQGGLAVDQVVVMPVPEHQNPAHFIVDPEDGLTDNEWFSNPELKGTTDYWEVKDPDGKVIEHNGDKIYFD